MNISEPVETKKRVDRRRYAKGSIVSIHNQQEIQKSPKITGGKRRVNVFPYKDSSKTAKVSQSVSLAKHETKRVTSAVVYKKVTSSD